MYIFVSLKKYLGKNGWVLRFLFFSSPPGTSKLFPKLLRNFYIPISSIQSSSWFIILHLLNYSQSNRYVVVCLHVLFCFFLINNDVEYLFMCLLTSHTSCVVLIFSPLFVFMLFYLLFFVFMLPSRKDSINIR